MGTWRTTKFQCHLHYGRKKRFLAYCAMNKSDNPNSLKHWAIIVIPYDEDYIPDDIEDDTELDIFHAVGDMSQLKFKKFTKKKINCSW